MWQSILMKMTRLNRTFSVNKVERPPSSSLLRWRPMSSISSPWIHTGKTDCLSLNNRWNWPGRGWSISRISLLKRAEKIVCQCIILLMYMLQSLVASAFCIWENVLQLVHFNAICRTNGFHYKLTGQIRKTKRPEEYLCEKMIQLCYLATLQIGSNSATPPGGKAFKNISTYFFAKGKNERGHKEIMALSFLVVLLLLLNVLFQSHESLE